MVKVIYIIGYGRSRSTVLDLTISEAFAKCYSLGEVALMGEYIAPCSCGGRACLWDNSEFINLITKYNNMECKRDNFTLIAILNLIKKYRSPECEVFVDSSKNASWKLLRPLIMKLRYGDNVRLIWIKPARLRIYSSVWRGVHKDGFRKVSLLRRTLRVLKTALSIEINQLFNLLLVCKYPETICVHSNDISNSKIMELLDQLDLGSPTFVGSLTGVRSDIMHGNRVKNKLPTFLS